MPPSMLDRRDPLADFAKIADEEDRRAKEALRVYRPASQQLPFHLSNAHQLILRGGKRSGKSLAVVAEFASRVTGRPLYGPHGEPIPLKYPVSTPKDTRLYWCIGWDVDHIGQTIYRYLFEPGIVRVIRDRATRQWRIYNPADPNDAERYDESVASEPMIPERLIDANSWFWESKAAHNFASVRLKNGAMICAYPSSSKHAKQGDAVDGIWIDEDIQIPAHMKEWEDRLTQRDGWMLWAVWPHTKNYALCELLDRADEQVEEERPNVQSYQLIMSQNPYIPQEAKERALGRMGSEEEIARRDRGELLLDTLAMYDFFFSLHTISQFEPGEMPQQVTNARDMLRKVYSQEGRFPREWTRYLSIDPSHSRTACLFAVVPPPEIDSVEIGNCVIVENELVVKKHTADALAAVIRPLVEGLNYEAFIMDQQMGRQTHTGEDTTVFEKYAAAFNARGIRSRLFPGTFIPGCNRPQDRYRAVRSMLSVNTHNIPTLLFIAARTPHAQSEFKTYRKKQLFIGGEDTILDEPANPRKHDVMAALEYLVAYLEQAFAVGMAYVPPETYQSRGSKAYRKALQIIRKEHEKHGGYVHLGPGAAA
jgi:hypothetical protein